MTHPNSYDPKAPLRTRRETSVTLRILAEHRLLPRTWCERILARAHADRLLSRASWSRVFNRKPLP